jgi:hypothetical protein
VHNTVFVIRISPFGWLAIAVLAFLLCGVWIAWLSRLLQTQRVSVNKVFLVLSILIGWAGWWIYGLGVWFMAYSLYPIAWADLPQLIISLSLSVILSILIVFVPNGIGIREATMSVLMQGVLPLPLGIVVSILARLCVMAGELICVSITFRRLKRMTSPSNG